MQANPKKIIEKTTSKKTTKVTIKGWVVLKKRSKLPWPYRIANETTIYKNKKKVNDEFISIPCSITYKLPK